MCAGIVVVSFGEAASAFAGTKALVANVSGVRGLDDPVSTSQSESELESTHSSCDSSDEDEPEIFVAVVNFFVRLGDLAGL